LWRATQVTFGDETRVANAQGTTGDRALQAEPRHAVDEIGRLRGTAKGACYGVFRAIFQRSRQCEAGIGIELVQWVQGIPCQTSLREGAGLVEDHRVDMVETFQHMTAREQ